MRAKRSHGFDSQLERRLSAAFGPHGKKRIPYKLEHTYNPDWLAIVTRADGARKAFLLEAKGIFRGSDRAKYTAIKEQYAELAKKLKVDSVELIFIFQDASVPVGRTKTNHGEWADKHGFKWFREGEAAALRARLESLGTVTYV